jgi:hypothetical protein
MRPTALNWLEYQSFAHYKIVPYKSCTGACNLLLLLLYSGLHNQLRCTITYRH